MFRSAFKHLAKSLGFALVSSRHRSLPFVQHPPQCAFDLILLKTFPDLRNLRFIQVGANDGQRVDPLLPYLNLHRWSGLMFEPLAANFSALSRRHGSNPRLRLHRAAIDTVAGQRPLFDVDRRSHPDLPDWAYGLASFSRERVVEALRELGLGESAVVAEDIRTMSWADVWSEFGPARCDLLVLDTEGYDLTLLHAADLSTHRPRVIHFEHACVDVGARLEFYRQILEHGYELATDGPDTTAWLKL